MFALMPRKKPYQINSKLNVATFLITLPKFSKVENDIKVNKL